MTDFSSRNIFGNFFCYYEIFLTKIGIRGARHLIWTNPLVKNVLKVIYLHIFRTSDYIYIYIYIHILLRFIFIVIY